MIPRSPHSPPNGTLLAFPGADSETPPRECPAEVQAWLDHAGTDPDLSLKLDNLARDLAVHVRPHDALPAPIPARRPWRPTWREVVLASVALILGGILVTRELSAPPPPVSVAQAPIPLREPPPAEIAVAQPVEAPLPAPPEAVPTPAPPSSRPKAPTQRTFRSQEQSSVIDLVPGVQVTLQGHLTLAGNERSPVASLTGTATFDVTPGSVERFVVESESSRVEVLGTRFQVDERPDGTRVTVQRGKVAVQCKAASSVVLDASQEVLCPVVSASGMLVLAHKLQQQGAPPAQVLEAVEKGLSYPVRQPSLHHSLWILRIEALRAAQRDDEAREAVRVYLASDAVLRRDHVARMGRDMGMDLPVED